VALLDISTGGLEWITADEWECESGNFHPSGQFVTYERNRDGNSEVFVFDTIIGARIDPFERPGLGTLGQQVFSPQGDRLLFSYSGPCEPNDLHTYDIAQQKTIKVTNSLLAGMNPEHMVEPYLVRYPSPTRLLKDRPRFSTCRTTWSATPAIRPSSACTAVPPRRPGTGSTAAFSFWSTTATR
jgi:hypothetical protein